MVLAGNETEEMCIQKAFGIMRERNSSLSQKDWRAILSCLLREKGESALYRYARTVELER